MFDGPLTAFDDLVLSLVWTMDHGTIVATSHFRGMICTEDSILRNMYLHRLAKMMGKIFR